MSDAASAAHIRQLHASGELQGAPGDTCCWLGVPLICGERTLGVLTVQSYDDGAKYTARDQELLTFISYQIARSEAHTSELQSLMRISYAVFCLQQKTPSYRT